MTVKKKKAANQGSFKKVVLVLGFIVLIALGFIGFTYYERYLAPNVNGNQEYLYIRTGATFDDVYREVADKQLVDDTTTFAWAARAMHYLNRVKPGRYKLIKGMNNRSLINMLAAGRQEPVAVAIKNLRLKENFAGFIAKKLEPDSATMLHLLDSDQYIAQFGFNRDNVYSMILPNTYQFYWTSTPKKIFSHLYLAYKKFWTDERRTKAAALGLNPIKVSILASIVDAEALHDDEMPTIAGLYLNRLKKGMKLESDPTVIYAIGDFTIHRVLNKELSYDSPYNTYKYAGLPPGPIMMPSLNALNSVLDYRKNNYIYMCAKEDFSGYHNFATTVAQHLANAHRFQQALNERNIKR